MWASGWQGKAALILGGGLALKGVADALTPTDVPQAPMGPDLRLPQAPQAPQFAIPTPDTRVSRPDSNAFQLEANVKGAYFDEPSLMDHLSTNIADSRLAFGQVTMDNRGMTETEMDYYLRDKMRSSF